jgi:hypothetical protein
MPFQFRKEAIEEDLNSNFPSQGQGNPPLYYSLSEVVVPTYSINSVAEGSTLPQNLQTAWDFSTGFNSVNNTTTTIINNTGFWQVDLTGSNTNSGGGSIIIQISDGVSTKTIWQAYFDANDFTITDGDFVVFVRSGDSVTVQSNNAAVFANVWYRQIAALNGDLVNPLGYSAA